MAMMLCLEGRGRSGRGRPADRSRGRDRTQSARGRRRPSRVTRLSDGAVSPEMTIDRSGCRSGRRRPARSADGPRGGGHLQAPRCMTGPPSIQLVHGQGARARRPSSAMRVVDVDALVRRTARHPLERRWSPGVERVERPSRRARSDCRSRRCDPSDGE